MQQLSLLPDYVPIRTVRHELVRKRFSHEGVCAEEARLALEDQYEHLFEETTRFNRRIASFQANKTETLHSWIKYREGFSAELVEKLIAAFGIRPPATILDPFAGSCTTLLVAKMLGLDAVGIELLPNCHLAWDAKSRVFEYDVNELRHVRQLLDEVRPPASSRRFPHLTITESAFPEQTESTLMAYTDWIEMLGISENSRVLCRLVLMSILESISYTRKDGQYLRWDGRARKIQERNQRRTAQGQKLISGINKGKLPGVKEALAEALDQVLADVVVLQQQAPLPSVQELIAANTLTALPIMDSDRFSGVITSPPYANRYDYTRTYALELAYLDVGDKIFGLRQNMLSCTVENRSKLEQLGEFYHSIGQGGRYAQIVKILNTNAALAEINRALQVRNDRGEINNAGVLPMINQYFSELTFVFAELHRVCQRGAHVAFVNDNVRYAGEVIPVDVLCTSLAEAVGFEPLKVYVLPQRKGNSSQQMSKFGRTALRKSITVWRKP
jgi:hypothetical protein